MTFGLIFEPQAMQQRDESRTAFVKQAEFSLDPGADLAHRARHRRADKDLQCVLRGAQKLVLPPMSKLARPSIPRCSKSLSQPRIVWLFNKTHQRLLGSST